MPEQSKSEPSAEERFREAMKTILAVPKDELLKREADDKERRKQTKQKDGE